jgi:hypothetical protein
VTHTSDSFSADYAEARDKFRAAAKDAGGALEAIGHPEPGAEGEALSTDVAWFGPRDAAAAIVLISATHGVEGFCGSGAQVDLLTRGEIARLPAGMAVLMIHGVNPYGFSWLRRVTHENVDLNRNWIDFDAALPENPGYDTLADAACPPNWSEESVASSARALVDYIKERGAAALQHALSGGQHKHPKGIFYGGLEPTWSRRTQTAILTSYLANTARDRLPHGPRSLGLWRTHRHRRAGQPRLRARGDVVGRGCDLAVRGHLDLGADHRRRPERHPPAATRRGGHRHGHRGRHPAAGSGDDGGARRQLAPRSRRPGLRTGTRDQGPDPRRLLRRHRRLERHGRRPVAAGLPPGGSRDSGVTL